MSKPTQDVQPMIRWPIFVTAIVVIVFWLANLKYGLTLSDKERGIFGDMFGAVNALFSGLAFAGVIYAVIMQRHEISIAKDEIAYTKKILDEQQRQLCLQNEEAKKQTFENTYFQMVSLFTEITNQIDLQRTEDAVSIVTKGKDVFPVFLARLRKIYNPPEKAMYGGHDFHAAYEEFYGKHNTELGHYFRLLFNIMNFIDSNEHIDQKFYSKILRAQLSDAETAILFYNCLSKFGVLKFKPLVEKYGLLKNVKAVDIFANELRDMYEPSAFGRRLENHEVEKGV
jgi:Putative phage abortive infection protein